MRPATWAWLDGTAFGPVAFLLLAHPRGHGTAGLAALLGLAEPGRRLPDLGERITVSAPGRAVVHADGGGCLLEVAVGERWSAFVADGGPVALVVGLEPLARRAPLAEVEDYLATGALTARIRLGISRRRAAGQPRTGG
ncbi:hypothetical protein ACIP98_02470 [Streptomyces sp. NPDC088354]|uniref:hypothetical protein n=1 Tax=unclassified Streptomyces TaxID=2593676 RepID=UPI0029A74E0B|nr:hypothetical protein [Streptomyces sp. MI02-7b]MDX3075991.1 hypothetical protein [Streptomyces sp. MI02-7b]